MRKFSLVLFKNDVLLVVWQVDLGWMPGAHQAVLSLSIPAGQGRENKMGKRLLGRDNAVNYSRSKSLDVNTKTNRFILYF